MSDDAVIVGGLTWCVARNRRVGTGASAGIVAVDPRQMLQRPRREGYCGWRRRFIDTSGNDQW